MSHIIRPPLACPRFGGIFLFLRSRWRLNHETPKQITTQTTWLATVSALPLQQLRYALYCAPTARVAVIYGEPKKDPNSMTSTQAGVQQTLVRKDNRTQALRRSIKPHALKEAAGTIWREVPTTIYSRECFRQVCHSILTLSVTAIIRNIFILLISIYHFHHAIIFIPLSWFFIWRLPLVVVHHKNPVSYGTLAVSSSALFASFYDTSPAYFFSAYFNNHQSKECTGRP